MRLPWVWDREYLEQFYVIYDRGWQNWPLPKKANCAYLRLKHRDGGYFYYFTSPDGKKWGDPGAHLGPPAKLQVGLAAYSTSSAPSKVRFDQLKLTLGKKEER